MLRPPELIAARHSMRSGAMPFDEYRAIEDLAVDDALKLQEEVGLEVVTDGEMRRDIFFGFFVNGMAGLVPGSAGKVVFHNDETDNAMEVEIPFTVASKVEPLPCPGVDEFVYASKRTSLPVKVTLPSPMMVLGFWGEGSRSAYPDPFELARDTAEVVKGWMKELADAGCRHIQIDAPEINEACVSEQIRAEYASRGIDPDEFIEVGTQLVGELGNLDLPGVTKSVHVCKGNGTQSWIAEGGYDVFAERVFASLSGFDVFHFEYDDERSGSLEPLKLLPDDKVAVLGFVSTKWVALEDPDELRNRIHEAAEFHPLERLALAPQCGFASGAETAADRKITEDTQRQKLQLVVDVARSVWQ